MFYPVIGGTQIFVVSLLGCVALHRICVPLHLASREVALLKTLGIPSLASG